MAGSLTITIDGDAKAYIDELDSLQAHTEQTFGKLSAMFEGSADKAGKAMASSGQALAQSLNSIDITKAVACGQLIADGLEMATAKAKALGTEVYNSVKVMQGLQKSVQSIVAGDLVKKGVATDYAEAMNLPQAKKGTDEVLAKIKEIALISPYEYSDVVKAFVDNANAGLSKDMALKTAEGLLNLSAGLGLDSASMKRLSTALAQTASTGTITSMDLKQFANNGFGMARMNEVFAVLSENTGVNIADNAEFNKAIKAGKISTEDYFQAFADYANTNYGAAAAAMAGTIDGLISTLNDIKASAVNDLFLETANDLSEALSPIVGWFQDLLNGGQFVEWGNRLRESLQPFIEGLRQIGEMLNSGEINSAFSSLISYLQGSGDNLTAFSETVNKLFGEETGGKITAFAEKLAEVFGWIRENSDLLIGALEGVGKALIGLFAINKISGLITGIVGMLSNPLTAILSLAALMGAAWKSNLGGIREQVAELGIKLHETFGGVEVLISPVIQMFNRLGDTVRNVFSGFAEGGFNGAFSALLDSLPTTISDSISSLSGLISNVISMASSLIPVLISAVQPVASVIIGVADTVLSVINDIVSFVSEHLAGLANLFAVSSVVNVLRSVVGFVVNISDILAGIIMSSPTLLTIVDAIGFAISSGMLAPLLAGVAAASSLVAGFINLGDIIKEKIGFTEFFAPIIDSAKNAFNNLIEGFSQLGEPLKQIFTDILSILSNVGTVLAAVLGEALMTLIPMILGVVSALDNVLAIIVNIISVITGAISGIIQTIKGAFEIVFGLFTANTELIQKGFSDLCLGIGHTIESVFGGIWESLVNLFKGLFDVISGIFDGIASGWHAVKSFISGGKSDNEGKISLSVETDNASKDIEKLVSEIPEEKRTLIYADTETAEEAVKTLYSSIPSEKIIHIATDADNVLTTAGESAVDIQKNIATDEAEEAFFMQDDFLPDYDFLLRDANFASAETFENSIGKLETLVETETGEIVSQETQFAQYSKEMAQQTETQNEIIESGNKHLTTLVDDFKASGTKLSTKQIVELGTLRDAINSGTAKDSEIQGYIMTLLATQAKNNGAPYKDTSALPEQEMSYRALGDMLLSSVSGNQQMSGWDDSALSELSSAIAGASQEAYKDAASELLNTYNKEMNLFDENKAYFDTFEKIFGGTFGDMTLEEFINRRMEETNLSKDFDEYYTNNVKNVDSKIKKLEKAGLTDKWLNKAFWGDERGAYQSQETYDYMQKYGAVGGDKAFETLTQTAIQNGTSELYDEFVKAGGAISQLPDMLSYLCDVSQMEAETLLDMLAMNSNGDLDNLLTSLAEYIGLDNSNSADMIDALGKISVSASISDKDGNGNKATSTPTAGQAQRPIDKNTLAQEVVAAMPLNGDGDYLMDYQALGEIYKKYGLIGDPNKNFAYITGQESLDKDTKTPMIQGQSWGSVYEDKELQGLIAHYRELEKAAIEAKNQTILDMDSPLQPASATGEESVDTTSINSLSQEITDIITAIGDKDLGSLFTAIAPDVVESWALFGTAIQSVTDSLMLLKENFFAEGGGGFDIMTLLPNLSAQEGFIDGWQEFALSFGTVTSSLQMMKNIFFGESGMDQQFSINDLLPAFDDETLESWSQMGVATSTIATGITTLYAIASGQATTDEEGNVVMSGDGGGGTLGTSGIMDMFTPFDPMVIESWTMMGEAVTTIASGLAQIWQLMVGNAEDEEEQTILTGFQKLAEYWDEEFTQSALNLANALAGVTDDGSVSENSLVAVLDHLATALGDAKNNTTSLVAAIGTLCGSTAKFAQAATEIKKDALQIADGFAAAAEKAWDLVAAMRELAALGGGGGGGDSGHVTYNADGTQNSGANHGNTRHYAHGGLAPNGTFIVGENGPELVSSSRSLNVFTNKTLMGEISDTAHKLNLISSAAGDVSPRSGQASYSTDNSQHFNTSIGNVYGEKYLEDVIESKFVELVRTELFLAS